jgi:phosphoglycolate phosphatase
MPVIDPHPVLLVFDFDGTLMDTLRDLAEAASDLAEFYGGRRMSEAEAAAMIGDGASAYVQRTLEAATVGLGHVPPDAVERYLAFYARRVFDHTKPYDGVAEMLRALAPSYRLTLLTNKPEASARALMSHSQIEAFFGECVFGDGRLERKPDPAGLRWLIDRAGTDAAHTMMVGDSIMDLEVARAAGTQLCLARYGFGFPRVDPDRLVATDLLIDSPLDLVERLRG